MNRSRLDAVGAGPHGSSPWTVTMSAARRTLASWVVTTCFLAASLAAQARPARVAVVLDHLPWIHAVEGCFSLAILVFNSLIVRFLKNAVSRSLPKGRQANSHWNQQKFRCPRMTLISKRNPSFQ